MTADTQRNEKRKQKMNINKKKIMNLVNMKKTMDTNEKKNMKIS